MTIGLAGRPGSGKSAVAQALARREGVEWIDLDRVAWEAYAPGTPSFRRVVERFGDEIVAPNGEIDRGELAVRVFLDADAKQDLEAIVHPAVIERLTALQAEHERRGTSLLLVEGALLTASPHVDRMLFDVVIWLEASESVRRARLAADGRVDHVGRGDGLSPGDAAVVVDAEGTVAEVADQVLAAIERT